jgi:hypothetical protein
MLRSTTGIDVYRAPLPCIPSAGSRRDLAANERRASATRPNTGAQIIRITRVLALAAWAATLTVCCPAQKLCPWLNAATASGFLGGHATLTVNMTGSSTGICIFQLQPADSGDRLTIAVVAAPAPLIRGQALSPFESQCSSTATPLAAVGNEAAMCADNSPTSRGEQVIGRVRDSVFTVALNTSDPGKPGAGNDLLAKKVEAIAEQVAGILF